MNDVSQPTPALIPAPADDGNLSLFDVHTELCNELTNEPSLSQAKAAGQIGISPAALSTYIRHVYKGDKDAVEVKISRWLLGRRRKVIAAKKVPKGIAWFEAATSKAITQALEYAQTMADIAVVIGGAGFGKTTTCEHYGETNSAVWYIRMSPSSASASACLTELAEVLGIRPARGEGTRSILKSIVRKVETTEGLIIVDEAQYLGKPALEELRAIHDEAKIGLALVGNESVYTQLTGGSNAAHYAQLFSRIGLKLMLTRPAKSDVHALATAWGITEPDALLVLEQISQQPGALRRATKTIRLAYLDEQAPTPPDAEALRRAWKYVGSER